MQYRLFDSHCHVNAVEFDADRDALLHRAFDAGVSGWLIPSVSHSEWHPLLAFCKTKPQTYAALGIHPWFVQDADLRVLDGLPQLLSEWPDLFKAIGETGLDRLKPHWSQQVAFFEAHLAMARDCGLPIIVHSVKAHQEVLALVKRYPQVTGIIHGFSGSLQIAQDYVSTGYVIGVGAVITYERAQKTRKAISQLPLEALVIETDAPSMPVSGFQGERNRPEQLRIIFEQLCHIRSEAPQEIAQQLWKNSQRLFGMTD